MTYTYCCVYSTSDGQKTFPKRVEFYSKNKFEKLVHLVGFIIRINVASSYGRKSKLQQRQFVSSYFIINTGTAEKNGRVMGKEVMIWLKRNL